MKILRLTPQDDTVSEIKWALALVGACGVAYLPKEKIVVAGDLVVLPIPYFYDGSPSEWSLTMHRLAS